MSKKLSKPALKKYRQWLALEYPLCQICHKQPIADAHHLLFGCYGADKDDSSQIAVCRDCHNYCHANKKESQDKYLEIAKNNFKRYERENIERY